MRILVIEDSPWNIASARLTLHEHEVIIAASVQGGHEALAWSREKGKPSYDAVLTDLFLPAEDFVGFGNMMSKQPPEIMPAGLVFALRAVNLNIPAVIVTDAGHHDDWIVNLLDLVGCPPHNDPKPRRVAVLDGCQMRGLWNEKKREITSEQDYDRNHFIKDWLLAMMLARLIPYNKEYASRNKQYKR